MCGRTPRDPKTWSCAGEGLVGTNFLQWWQSKIQEAPVQFAPTNLQGSGYRFEVDIRARPALLAPDVAAAIDGLRAMGTPVGFETRTVIRYQGGQAVRLTYARTLTGTITHVQEYPWVRLDSPLRIDPTPENKLRSVRYGFTFLDPVGRDMARFVEAAIGALFLQVVTGELPLDPPWAEDRRMGKRGVRSCENCAFLYRIPVRDEPVWVEGDPPQLVGDGDERHIDSGMFRYEPSSNRPVTSDFGVPGRTGGWAWPRHVCLLKMEELDTEVARCINFDRHFPHETYEPLQGRRARKILWEQEAISHAERCPYHHWDLDIGGTTIQERGRVGRMYTEPSIPVVEMVDRREWAVVAPGPMEPEAPGMKLGSLKPTWDRPGALQPIVCRVPIEGPVVQLPGWVFTTKPGVLAA